jgi:cellulose synthase/poly-beta-1,6-N-acetylglucosamine synthase-like glycosyltransferase
MYFLVVLIILNTLLLVYPYLVYPLSMAVISSIRANSPVPSTVARGSVSSVSLICCFHNEAEVLDEKLLNLYDVCKQLPGCEIVLYDDASTDTSNQVFRAQGTKIQLITGSKQAGKTAGINELNSRIRGDIVIFSDANVIIEPATVSLLTTYFDDPSVGCVSGTLHYINSRESNTAYTGATYRKFEEWLKRIETTTGTIVYTDGTLFAVRRHLFPKIPPDLTDDFYIALNVLKHGFRIVAAPDFVGYERASTRSSDEFWRRVRIGCNSFSCHLYMWQHIKMLDWLTLYKYTSHKFIRWLSAYFLALNIVLVFILVSIMLGIAWAVAGILLLGGILLALSGLGNEKISRAFEALGAVIATGYGVFLAVKGHRFGVWKISESSRKKP